MKNKVLGLLMAGVLSVSMLAGCTAAPTQQAAVTEEVTETPAAEETAPEAADDQVAADNVAALIDGIYVQARTADTVHFHEGTCRVPTGSHRYRCRWTIFHDFHC